MIRAVLLSLALVISAAPSLAAQPSAAQNKFEQLLQSAEKARDDNRDDESIRLFRQALSVQPESEQALWFLGSMLYEKAEYEETRDVLRQFVTLRPDAGPAWALLGLGEFQLREYARALDHLQRAMAQGMGDRKELIQTVYYHVVVLLIRFERFDESDDMLQKMLASGAPGPEYVEPAGLAGLRLPLLPSEIPPQRREVINLAGRSVLALLTERYEDADTEFKQLVSAYPAEPGVHFLYGAYLEQLHPVESAAEFTRELEISPTSVLARIRLANQLITQRKFDDALKLSREAIKLDPQRASAHMLAGEALLAGKIKADGLKELEIARDAAPEEVRTHWDLLRAYAAAGRTADANREKEAIEKLNDAHLHNRPSIAADKLSEQSAPSN